MQRLKISWFQAVAVIALAGSVSMIAMQVMQKKNLEPGAKDIARSGRVLSPKEGVDERMPAMDPKMVSGSGIIEPQERETKVAAASAGLILRIHVKEGQVVQAGQLLVEMESSAERMAAESAREEIESARRDLDKVKAGERPETIAAVQEDLEAARAKAAQSREAMERLSGLAAKDLVTRDEYDRARRQAHQDSAMAAASKARHLALANGPRKEDVAIQEARVAQAMKKLAEREAAIGLRQVRAIGAGTVLQVKYRAGEYYLPTGEPLMLMGNLKKLRVRVDIDERDIGRVRVGQAGYVTAPAFPNRRFAARIAEIGHRIGRKNIRTDDPKERIDTKILEVLLDVEEGGAELLPGLRVVAVIGGGNRL